MLNIENRGVQIFGDDTLKFRNAFNDKEALEQLADMAERRQSDSDLLFYVDNKGEECGNEDGEKMSESMNAVFTNAAQSMQSSEQGKRKRKTEDGKKRNKVQFVKYNITQPSSLSEAKADLPRNDNSDCGSDLENPSSDME